MRRSTAAEPSYPCARWHAHFTGVQSVVMLLDLQVLKRSMFTAWSTDVCVHMAQRF